MPLIRSLRLRYTLRALLVFVTLFCLWGGYETNRCIKERQAEETLKRRGASFDYGPKRSGTGLLASVQFYYQRLVQIVWRARFVTRASITSPLEPEVVAAIAALPHLEHLGLEPRRRATEEQRLFFEEKIVNASASVPPGSMQRILGGRQLKILWIGPWILSDDDCATIARHQSLESISVNGCEFSEDGLAQLITLPKLRYFGFSYCKVTGEKLPSIPASQSLEHIECDGTPVGESFADFVRRSPNIVALTVCHKSIDDSFVAKLSGHPALRVIDLNATSVTDRCISAIEEWHGSLDTVVLPRSSVSKTRFEQLREKRPDLKLFH